MMIKHIILAIGLMLAGNAVGQQLQSNLNIVPEVMAYGRYIQNTNCVWAASAFGGGSFPSDGDCLAITIDYQSDKATIDTSNNGVPDIVFDYLPPGTYEVTAQGVFYGNVASNHYFLAIGNGITQGGNTTFYDNAANNIQVKTLVGVFAHAGGAVTYSMYGGRVTPGTEVRIENQSYNQQLQFTVKRFK